MLVYQNPSLQAFADFIEVECDRCSLENGNRFAAALECVFKKYRAIWILKDRGSPVATEYGLSLRKMREIPCGPMSSESMRCWAQQRNLKIELELLCKCFFLYSAILCDEFAHLLLFLFGDARGIQLSGHRVLSKNFAEYAAAKQLVYEPELVELARYLETEVCDFRDKQIVHDFHPRKHDGLSIDEMTGDVHLLSGISYPKDTDSCVVSKGWNELSSKLDRYVKFQLRLISVNFGKTRFNA